MEDPATGRRRALPTVLARHLARVRSRPGTAAQAALARAVAADRRRRRSLPAGGGLGHRARSGRRLPRAAPGQLRQQLQQRDQDRPRADRQRLSGQSGSSRRADGHVGGGRLPAARSSTISSPARRWPRTPRSTPIPRRWSAAIVERLEQDACRARTRPPSWCCWPAFGCGGCAAGCWRPGSRRPLTRRRSFAAYAVGAGAGRRLDPGPERPPRGSGSTSVSARQPVRHGSGWTTCCWPICSIAASRASPCWPVGSRRRSTTTSRTATENLAGQRAPASSGRRPARR